MARILLFGGRNSNIRKSINSTGGNMIYVYNRGAIFGITVGKVSHTDCIIVGYAPDVAWDLFHDNGIGGICVFCVNIIDLFRTDDNPMLGKNSRLGGSIILSKGGIWIVCNKFLRVFGHGVTSAVIGRGYLHPIVVGYK